MSAIETQKSGNQTKIINEKFNFEFTLEKDCYIDNRFMHYLPGGSSWWSSHLFCDGIKNPLELSVGYYDENKLDEYGYSKISDRFFVNEGKHKNILLLVDPTQENDFIIVSYIGSDNETIWQEIRDTIKVSK